MNITLIQPFTANLEPPLSIAFLSGYLKKAGHSVRIIDLQIPQVRDQWKSVLDSEPTDLIGISTMTPQVKEAHEIAKWIKDTFPNIPVIVGGAHPTLLPEQTLNEFKDFDIIVIGEGEETIVELVDHLERDKEISNVAGIGYRKDGQNILTGRRNRIINLDNLPNPHENYDFKFYLDNNSFGFTEKCVSMIVSRGCPYNCKFCATKNFWTKKYICKTTAGVIEEIRYVLSQGANGIVFRDSTFNVNKEWVYELCGKIIKEDLRFKWAVNARVNLVDYDLFQYMKKAGLDTVYFGVESGSQKMLEFYGKDITIEQTEKAFNICKKLKLHTGAYFMLGSLPETLEDVELTYQLAKRIKPDTSLVFLFMPLPGSELYQYYIEHGYTFDYNNIRSDKANFNSAEMTIEELEAFRRKWYCDLNKKPNVFLRGLNCIMNVRSFHDLQQAWKKIIYRVHDEI